jgi:hypothetical protein
LLPCAARNVSTAPISEVGAMASQTLLYFVKFFAEETYADQFMKGGLYLNRLSYFKKLESEGDDGRPDAHEGVAMWWQPHDFVMTLSVPGIGETQITKDDLAAPVSMSFDYHNHLHVLCLYTIVIDSIDVNTPDFDIGNAEGRLRNQLKVDERCFAFGKFAVVIQAAKFRTYLKEFLEREGIICRGNIVQYYDEETFHGEIAPRDVPFRKQKKFAYQHEYRFTVHTNTQGDDPLMLNIGDIENFAQRLSRQE